MKKTGFIISLLCLFVITSNAQQQPVRKKKKEPTYGSWLSFNLLMGLPMQEYKATTSSLPFGLNIHYLYQPSVKVPLAIGLDLDYLNAGTKSIDRDIYAQITVGNTVIDEIHIPLEFEINNNILAAHVVGRFIAPTDYVKPYVDGLMGLNYLWTGTAVYDRSEEHYFKTDNDDGLITRKSQLEDVTYSLGAGAGLLFQIGRKSFVNVGVHYTFGGAARYYDKEQIQNWDIQLDVSSVTQEAQEGEFEADDLDLNAIPKKSKTDMLMIQAGFTFNLAK